MPDKDPHDFGALIKELKKQPRYQDPRVKAVLDEAFPRLEILHRTGNQAGLLQVLREIKGKVDEILAPAPAGPPPEAEPPAEEEEDEDDDDATEDDTEPEPPEGPDPNVPPLDNTVPDSFEGMTDMEVVRNLSRQYDERIRTLQYFGLIDAFSSILIIDINGQLRPAPIFAEIEFKLLIPEFLQKIRQFKRPTLLLTPIGMSLQELAEKVGEKRGRLLRHNSVTTISLKLNEDETGNLMYFPERYAGNHGGLTKRELLTHAGNKNLFRGWTVTVVEGMSEIDLEAIKIKPPPTDPNAPKYKDAHQYLQEMKEAGLSGLTPEEWLMLHAEGVRRGMPFDQHMTWLLAVYRKAHGKVPDSLFNPIGAHVDMRSEDPGDIFGRRGARRVARG